AVALETNVRAALQVLHRSGFVHLDVAPHNILRVGGRWKLADLDSCTEIGAVAERHPTDERFLHPDRQARINNVELVPARPEYDLYGLEPTVRLLSSV